MGLFSPTIKTICNVIFENNSSKFFLRVYSNKTPKRDIEEILISEDEEEITEKFRKFIEDNSERKTYYSIMLRDLRQGIAESKAKLITDEITEENYFISRLDKNSFIYSPKEEITNLESKFGVSFDCYLPTLKILYTLLRKQEFEAVSLFILKTDEDITFIIANKKQIFYYSVVSITDAFLELSLRDNLNIEIDDIDEVFFVIMKEELLKYYATEDAEFVSNIYIYNNGSLNNEISYVIYTRLLIVTNLIPLKIFDAMSEIALKESK